jgi:phosphoribosylanthranilate isomerase
MTSADDVAMAVKAGADAVGMIVAESERRVTLERAAAIAAAIPPFVTGVGVVDEDTSVVPSLDALGLTIQFSGPTEAAVCEQLTHGRPYIKVFHVAPTGDVEPASQDGSLAYVHALWMFDTLAPGRLGGSGITFRWELLEEIGRERPVIVSGGLTPENVGALLRLVRPYAVDVRSGIERDGKKDPARMTAFVRAVREADGAAMHASP